jgi:hypothetical protein
MSLISSRHTVVAENRLQLSDYELKIVELQLLLDAKVVCCPLNGPCRSCLTSCSLETKMQRKGSQSWKQN